MRGSVCAAALVLGMSEANDSADCQYLTPPQIATRLRVSPDKIVAWIRSGELRAFNVASEKAMSPRWRVAEADLQTFLDRRSNPAPNPPPQKRARRKKSDAFVEYF